MSRSSTPRGQDPVVEMVKSYPDWPPKCQRVRERETARRQDDHQHEHRPPNPQRRRKKNQSTQASSRGRHQREFKRCARGSTRLWTRWAATRPSGRRWALRCVTHLSLARFPTFQLTHYYLSMLRVPRHRLFFLAFDEGRISDCDAHFTHALVPNQGRGDRRSQGQAPSPRRARRHARPPRGYASYRGAGRRGPRTPSAK